MIETLILFLTESIPKDAKLYLNIKVLSETEIVLYSRLQSLGKIDLFQHSITHE